MGARAHSSAGAAALSIDDGLPTILARLLDGAVLLGARDRSILDANDAFISLLGYEVHELRALPSLHSLAAPADPSAPRDDLFDARGRLATRFELPFARKDGRLVHTEVSVSPIDTNVHLALFRDVTSRKRKEDALLRVSDALEQGIRERSDELEHANNALAEAVRARDEFLSIASHELRTPLTPLLLQLQRLAREGRAVEGDVGPVIRKGLDATLRHMSRMIRLVDQLLDVSRLQRHDLALERSSLDLVALVRDVLARSEDDLTRARCSVTFTADERIVGTWDPMRLEQIAVNLLTNAIKYGAGHPIDVELRSEGSRVRLSVRDRGIGIGEFDQRRIFERFERAVSTSHYGGFGLGLWIAQRAAQAHGGAITVMSAPGEGSAFVVDLPRG